MWKYECKRHLLYMTTGVIIGALVFGALGWQREGLLATLEMVTSDKAILQDPMTPYLMGALAIGGLVNGLMLMFQLMQRFNINYFSRHGITVTGICRMYLWLADCAESW